MMKLFVPVGILLAASFLVLASVSPERFALQFLWVVFGILFVALFLFVDWRTIFNYRGVIWGMYLLSIIMLLAAYWSGPIIRNIRGWLVLGPLHFQPVELAKIALIFLYAAYFARRHIAIARWQVIATSFLYFAIPAGLVALQPDLGSVLVLFGIWFGFLLASGLPKSKIILISSILILCAVFGWYYLLEDYQRARIVGAFYPERDILGINYSMTQSKIAIGSAGFFGKGFGQGTQTQLGFLTEPATDFAFTAFVEEWGWALGIFVVAAVVYLLLRILAIGMIADRNFEKFVCLGAAIIFGLEFFINTGSATGILPVVGLPFPFVSYGGSNLLTSFILLAIVNAIAIRS